MTNSLPRLTRTRRDGWSPEVQQAFLDELAYTASASQAAAAVGRSVKSAYKLRARPDATAFRDGWKAALAMSMTLLRETALDRAFNGHKAPIHKYGNKVGERQVMRDSVLISMLRLYDAPMFHEERAREAVVAALPKPMTQAEWRAKFIEILEPFERQSDQQVADNADGIASLPVAFVSPFAVD